MRWDARDQETNAHEFKRMYPNLQEEIPINRIYFSLNTQQYFLIYYCEYETI